MTYNDDSDLADRKFNVTSLIDGKIGVNMLSRLFGPQMHLGRLVVFKNLGGTSKSQIRKSYLHIKTLDS